MDVLQVLVVDTEAEEDVQIDTEEENEADGLVRLVTDVDGLVPPDMLFATVAVPTLVIDARTDGLAVALVDNDGTIEVLAEELMVGVDVRVIEGLAEGAAEAAGIATP